MRPKKLIFLVICCLVGCSGPRGVEKRIDQYIAKTCNEHWPCVVNLQAATPFDWDKMYVFQYGARQSEIEHAIGAKLPDYRELSRYLIFTKAGKIVLSEDEPTNVEHIVKGELVFEMPDGDHYRKYSAGSIFVVTQESSKESPYYMLRLKK